MKGGFLRFRFFVFLAAVMVGCAGGGKEVRREEVFVPPPVEPIESVRTGSLWREDGPLSELFINPKARRIGDVVTIRIVEASSASNKADTNTARKSSLSAGIDGFFNAEKRFPADQPFFNPFSRVRGDLTSSFDGKGKTTRSGDLTAYITARIIGVLPNGNLTIAGTREVTVNNETQLISLMGIIRSRDISPENVILSTYISDAKIVYSGSGIVQDRQRPGWLTRIFDTIWPF
jgi:flagellar L-ring protein precursor FlgH